MLGWGSEGVLGLALGVILHRGQNVSRNISHLNQKIAIITNSPNAKQILTPHGPINILPQNAVGQQQGTIMRGLEEEGGDFRVEFHACGGGLCGGEGASEGVVGG